MLTKPRIQIQQDKDALPNPGLQASIYNFRFSLGEVSGACLLYNSRTNAVLRISKQLAAQLDNALDASPITVEALTQKLPADLVDALKSGGFVVDASLDERRLLKAMDQNARFGSARLALTIAPTLACNLRCPYCYQDHKSRHMNAEVTERIKAFVSKQLRYLSDFSVSWYGGEPLLVKDRVLDLQRYFFAACKEANVNFGSSMITNGYLLEEELARTLSNTGVSFVQITLDGAAPSHNKRRKLKNGRGTFDRIYENLKTASLHFERISLRVNIDKTNPEDLDIIRDMVARDGLADKVYVYPGKVDAVTDASRAYAQNCYTRREFAEYEVQRGMEALTRGEDIETFPRLGNGCGAICSNAFVIDPDGYLYKCWNDVGERDACVGLLSEQGEKYRPQLAQWEAFDRFESEECRACPYLPLCIAGCSYEEIAHGDASHKCTEFRWNLEEIVKLKYVSDLRHRLQSEGGASV